MPDKKKAETKNQHYVPQFYQRYFSADTNHKTIGAYAIKQRKYIPSAPIKNQSSGDYFYSDNQKIEDSLSRVEALASSVFDKIISNPKTPLSKEDWYIVYVFTFLQIGRTLDRANFLQEMADKTLKSMMKKYVEAMRLTDKAEEVKLLTDDVLDQVDYNLQKPAMLSLGQHAQMVNTCIDLNMKVLINNTEEPFITSDNPASMYSMFLEKVGFPTYALGSKGLIFYLPLTSKLAIMYYDPMCYKLGDKKKCYVEISDVKDIANLNKLTACYANEMLYCINGSFSSYDLEQLANSHDKYKPTDRVATFEFAKQENSQIIGTATNSIYCNLQLSFAKELPSIKAINRKNFNPNDRFRPIAYFKDELIRHTGNKQPAND